MDNSRRLLELYGIRNELLHKYFDLGLGRYGDQIRELDEDIALLGGAQKSSFVLDPLLVPPDAVKTEERKTIIHINKEKGIYIDKTRKYEISRKRLDCVLKLLESDSLTAEDLEEFWSTSSQITNEIKKINALTRNNLGIEHDLITHSKSARSYSLNREELNIEPS